MEQRHAAAGEEAAEGQAVTAALRVMPPVVPSRGYATPYRERKLAAHTTRAGRGRVARALAPPRRRKGRA